MITLYTYPTPNGHKISILFEELALPYRVRRLNLFGGEARTPEYLRIHPLGKMPAVVEALPDGRQRRLFGSGAIMQFYAESSGQLLPTDPDARAEALSWFALGISDLGPAAVDVFRFSARAPEKTSYAIDLLKGELIRSYTALNDRLGEVEYLAGEYSLADIACFPFITTASAARDGLLDRFVHMKRWHDTIKARPAVLRGLAVPG